MSVRIRTIFLACVVTASLVSLSPAHAAPPSNDNWASAQQIDPGFSGTIDVREASREFGEPDCYWSSGDSWSTVWFRWTATTTRTAVATVIGQQISTHISVHTGPSLKDLKSVECDSGNEGVRARAPWRPVIGETYYIKIGGYQEHRGDIDFSFTIPAAPENDLISGAKTIDPGEPVDFSDLSEENAGAGAEGEPAPTCLSWIAGRSDVPTIWYKLTTAAGSPSDFVYHPIGQYPFVALWKKATDGSLIYESCTGSDVLRLTPEPMTTYYFQVIGPYYGGAPMGLHVHPPLPNDHFAESQNIDSLPFNYEGDVFNATTEAEEKRPSCLTYTRGSVWFTYTAPRDMVLSLTAIGDGDASYAWVAAWKGSALTDLQQVGCKGSSSIGHVEMRAGETVHLQAGYRFNYMSSFQFAVAEVGPVTNDGPLTARQITESMVMDTTIREATGPARLSRDEPAPSCGRNPGSTVWFSITSPVTGPATVDTQSSNYDTVVAIYDPSLRELACGDDSSDWTSKLSYDFAAGSTYLISVSGNERSRGELSLRLRHGSSPNDNFEQAKVIPGTPFAEVASTRFATMQPGEPQPSPECIGNTEPRKVGFSVWYRFTPQQDMALTASVLGNNLQTLVSVYTGDALNSLTQVACTGPLPNLAPGVQSPRLQAASFQAKAGTTYHFQVSHRATAGSSTVPFQLSSADGGAL